MKQHYTGEFCPVCIKKGLPCPVLHKNKIEFFCQECGFTAPLIGTDGKLF